MKRLLLILLVMLLPLKVKAYGTSATSAILMDIDSGRIIYSNNIHNVRSVASISKIMTAIVAIENSNIKKEVIIGDEINGAYGSGIYIKSGEKLTIENLLYGLMLRSGNDAALAIAHNVGDDFIKLMNNTAKKIGMKNSTFNNPSGLDADKGNYSTAYDMAILMSYAMKNKTFKKITGTKKYKLKTNLNTYSWTNKNRLLNTYKYATGGKTGFTDKARRTLVTTASKNNLNLVAVTLNDGDDFLDHKNLFKEAFSEFKSYKILNSGIVSIAGETHYKNSVLKIKNNFSYPLLDSEKDSILIKYQLEKKREYKNGDAVGKAIVYLADKEIHSEDIYVENKPVKKGFWIFKW